MTRRVLPVVGGAADVFMRYIKEQKEAGAAFKKLLDMDVAEIIEPLAKALGAMSDADSRFVITTCLSKVQRATGTGDWASVTAANGGLMFADIEMPQMLQIVWKVIEVNLLSFSSAQPALTSAAGRA